MIMKKSKIRKIGYAELKVRGRKRTMESTGGRGMVYIPQVRWRMPHTEITENTEISATMKTHGRSTWIADR